jgi:hypothetical protein
MLGKLLREGRVQELEDIGIRVLQYVLSIVSRLMVRDVNIYICVFESFQSLRYEPFSQA